MAETWFTTHGKARNMNLISF